MCLTLRAVVLCLSFLTAITGSSTAPHSNRLPAACASVMVGTSHTPLIIIAASPEVKSATVAG